MSPIIKLAKVSQSLAGESLIVYGSRIASPMVMAHTGAPRNAFQHVFFLPRNAFIALAHAFLAKRAQQACHAAIEQRT